jgi:NAD(P)-dependent dehydrogenase (short-subunit alcohol dehydrogenase family)
LQAIAADVWDRGGIAGVLEGGSVLDIPGSNMRHEFEVNVIGPLLLTQGIAKQMVKRGKGANRVGVVSRGLEHEPIHRNLFSIEACG